MGTKMVATWRVDNLQWVSEFFYTIVWCCHDYEKQCTLANEKKADEAGEGAVGFGGFGRNTLCFHTQHHCYLRYFLLKDTLQIRMVDHGLSTEVFFFDNSTVHSLRSHASAKWNARKKGTIFSFSPLPLPFNLRTINPSRFYFHTRARQYLKRKERACEQARLNTNEFKLLRENM